MSPAQPTPATPTLADIEIRARRFAEARERVSAIVAALDEAIEALKRSELPKLRRAVATAAGEHDALQALVAAAPELFQRPKTVTFHGIRLGYRKGAGGIEWDDPDAVVAQIRKLLPDQAETLIRWTAKPLKEALNQLDVGTLRKLGCRVDALLKDATEDMRG